MYSVVLKRTAKAYVYSNGRYVPRYATATGRATANTQYEAYKKARKQAFILASARVHKYTQTNTCGRSYSQERPQDIHIESPVPMQAPLPEIAPQADQPEIEMQDAQPEIEMQDAQSEIEMQDAQPEIAPQVISPVDNQLNIMFKAATVRVNAAERHLVACLTARILASTAFDAAAAKMNACECSLGDAISMGDLTGPVQTNYEANTLGLVEPSPPNGQATSLCALASRLVLLCQEEYEAACTARWEAEAHVNHCREKVVQAGAAMGDAIMLRDKVLSILDRRSP